jgi:putative endonuclease
MDRQQIGKLGEDYAEKYLTTQNYQIIKRNYHCKFGEIDLIAQKFSQLRFIEVKTRTSDQFGTPEAALTYPKKSKILKTALTFLSQNYPNRALSWRIDLITVKLNQQNDLQDINHYKNVLDG